MAVGRLSKLSVFLSYLLLVFAIHHINLGYETSYSITDIKLGQIFARPPILIRKSQSSCFATNRPLVRWNKHGGTVIALPSDDRLYDINILILICGDVHPLPSPDSLSSRKGNNSNKLLDLPKAGVNIVSWNICHISNKLDELAHLLLHGNIDILGLQETFLNSNTLDSVLQVNGFNFFRKDRGANGGGILVYIRNSLKVLRRSDLESDDCEMLWLQLFERKHSAISLIGFIYRPPSSDSLLDECIASNIEAARIKSSKFYILGDVNVNILNRTSNNNNLFKALKDLGLRQIVNSVTRPSSSACLDNIYTNCQNSTTHCKVHEIGLSDHFPISFTLRKPKQSRNHHLVKTFRSFKNFDEHEFYQDLQSAPWSILDVFTDNPDSYLSNWYLIFNDVLDKHAPLITKRVKMEKQAPWWNSEINSARIIRNNALKKARKSGSLGDWSSYKSSRNSVYYLIRKAKSEYFRNTLNQKNLNPKDYWNHLKLLTGRKVNIVPTIVTGSNGNLITDPKSIAEEFNNTFISMADNLLELRMNTAESSTNDLECRLKLFVASRKPDDELFTIPLITTELIIKYVKSLSDNAATGPDNVPTYAIKQAISIAAGHLTFVINSFFSNGEFPDAWKMARVTPIFKSGEQDLVINYRPISILPALSKIVERHVFLSLSSWFNKYNLLFSSQSSYRKHHSCITAMVNLVDQLIANMDDKLISSLLMIDLSKAFDTINRELLITKLSIYGVSPSSLKWFKAYLTSRRQYVRIDNVDSNSQIIRHGVPQGSILGPLLFIIFMNDINLVPISDCELHLYADDTTMLTCSPTMDQLMTTTNQALTTIVDWFLKNKLIVNLKKTECMTVMTKAKERFTSENNSTLSIDGNQIKQVFHHKLLGLVIDSHLTWNDHVDYIVSKAASRLFLLKKIKPFLSLKERKLFYSSMIMPVLEYGSVIWGDFYVGITERLLKQQKRAARIILDVKKPTDTPSPDLFAKLNWLSFDKRIILQRGTLVYKCLNNLAPDYLCNIFTKLKDTRSRITRAFTNDKLALQRKFRLAVGQKSFLYRGTHLWNSLPLEITKSNDLKNFE